MNVRKAAGGLSLAAAVAVALGVTAPAAIAGTPRTTGTTTHAQDTALQDDFNGDGYADVAMPAPDATVAGHPKAGYVAVMYGSPGGLTTASKQVLDQDKPGVPGAAEADDRYGSSVTSADLDDDGYADLVVGCVGEDTAGGGENAGSLAVIWGSADGLGTATTLLDGSEGAGLVGAHIVAGDFDGDGARDIVTTTSVGHGAGDANLHVLSGPFDRVGTPGGGTRDISDPYDGITVVEDLAAGDVNSDGTTDLAAVANDTDEFDARRIVLWQGGADGLSDGEVLRKRDGNRVEGGENLDLGDVNGDGYDDIVVGRAIDGYDSDVDQPLAKGGMISYVPGSVNGPVIAGLQTLNQDTGGVPGSAERGDGFGTGLSVGDVDGDGFADIAVGDQREDLGDTVNAGSVVVLHGNDIGLSPDYAQVLTQDTAGVPGVAEDGDTFGSATKLVDTDGDGRAELVAGAAGENDSAGSIWVFASDVSGVTTSGSFTFGAGTLGTVAAGARLGAGFGF